MKASVKLEQGMTFLGTADSGFPVQMDSSKAVGGDDDGVRPMELVLIGLGGCTAMDVISILRKKRQNITDFEVTLAAERAKEHPHVFTHITVKYIVHGREVDPKAVERAIELSKTKYCPAQAMLAQSVEIDHVYEIIEDE